MSTAGTSSERRRSFRHTACFLAYLEKDGGDRRRAVVRDASETGVYLLTRAPLSVGEAVALRLFVRPGPDGERHVRGRVVRTEPQLTGWPVGAGVVFDEPLGWDPELSNLEAVQRMVAAQASSSGASARR